MTTLLIPSTGELKVVGVVLLVLLVTMVYVVAEFLWRNRRGR